MAVIWHIDTEEMTALKIEERPKTILDFTGLKSSKNSVRMALQQCQINNIIEGKTGELTIFRNEIKVGMYRIVLALPPDSPTDCSRLKDYKDFEVLVYDEEDIAINLKKDKRFKDQYWVQYNFFGKLRTTHLADIILYCQRLDRLRAFL